MQLVADANVWYHIDSGRIDPDQFNRYCGGLWATPTSLLEIASGIDERLLQERKGAASAVLNYAAGVLEDTETHLAKLWDVNIPSAQVAWIEGFKTISLATSVEELESGVADYASRTLRRVGMSTLHDWRTMHWRGFQNEIVTALDEWIPGYREARTNGKYIRIAKQNRAAFQEAIRSREVKGMLALATYARVSLAATDLPDPSDDQIASAEPLLAPYIDAYSEYIIRCATDYAPQENLQPETALVTSDDRWIEIGQVVCPDHIIVPEVR